MTNKVNPSPFRPTEAFKTAGAISHGGGSNGYVVDGFTDIAEEDGAIDETQLNNFQESHNSSSFDVTIDPGEAFVFGAWVVKDTATTVTLNSSTNNQTVYVGWEEDTSDTVFIGTDSDVSGSGEYYERIPLWEFDTDGSGVTSVEDYRTLGQQLSAAEVSVLSSIDSNRVLRINSGYSMTTGDSFEVNGELSVDGGFTASGPIYGTGLITGTGTVSSSGAIEEQ